jgi:hypothetical protein
LVIANRVVVVGYQFPEQTGSFAREPPQRADAKCLCRSVVLRPKATCALRSQRAADGDVLIRSPIGKHSTTPIVSLRRCRPQCLQGPESLLLIAHATTTDEAVLGEGVILCVVRAAAASQLAEPAVNEAMLSERSPSEWHTVNKSVWRDSHAVDHR